MIVDVCAHLGAFTRRPAGTPAAADLARLLAPYGVTRVYAGPLEALWYENPHDANRADRPGGDLPAGITIVAVPVLDPTIATWRQELDRLMRAGPPAMVRLHPNYGGYSLRDADADVLLAELARRKVVAQVVVRMDDPRRQHPQAQVPDVPAAEVLDAAVRHPGLALLLSGAAGPTLQGLTKRLRPVRNLWADTSQADGVRTIADLVETDWRDRLVFGSHAPLFIPYAALARVVLDLDDAAATPILQDNPAALLGLPRH